jgi:Rod binding domain-containing protein
MTVPVPSNVIPLQVPPTGEARKMLRAAQDFESVLMGELLRSLQKTLSAVPGNNAGAGDEDYQYLGTEALASALAARGGLGLGRMIARNLVRNQPGTGEGGTDLRPFGE